ncbi:MAG: hypothetical protein J7L37_06805 [Thermococcus sp.]|nr:hypothetical protein [Thermococcus sp.]
MRKVIPEAYEIKLPHEALWGFLVLFTAIILSILNPRGDCEGKSLERSPLWGWHLLGLCDNSRRVVVFSLKKLREAW